MHATTGLFFICYNNASESEILQEMMKPLKYVIYLVTMTVCAREYWHILQLFPQCLRLQNTARSDGNADMFDLFSDHDCC